MRGVAVALVVTIYFAIVAAHQLTPYMALAGVGALTLLDLVRPRWLVVLLAAIAAGYLALHYGLISQQFGGLFSGGNPIANAGGAPWHPQRSAPPRSGRRGSWLRWPAACGFGAGRDRTPTPTARNDRHPGGTRLEPVRDPAGTKLRWGSDLPRLYVLGAVVCAPDRGGALRAAPALRWRSWCSPSAWGMFVGLQGLYGPVSVNAFTPRGVTASGWLYSHTPPGSVIVLPVDDFPALGAADYNDYNVNVPAADPQLGPATMDEGTVDRWRAGWPVLASGRSTW